MKRKEPEIRRFRLAEIRPAKYNPHTISNQALAGLTASLKRFGCVEPIVVNIRGGKNTIIGGHQRHKALIKLHGDKYECLCVAVSLNAAEEKLLNLTLNNPKIQGEFIEGLAEYIDRLKKEIGDDAAMLELQIEELQKDLPEPEEKIGKIRDDDIPRPPKTAITRTGDIWVLGEHRLMCGDSTNEKDVTRLMAGKKAALFATDPPYCVDYTGIDRPGGGHNWTDVYHEIDIPDASKFIKAFYEVGLKFVGDNTALYLWHAERKIVEIHNVCKDLDILVHQKIIWIKPCVVMSFTVYSWRHEPCLLMWKRGHKPPYRAKEKTPGSVWPVNYVKSGDPSTPEYYTDVWELDWDGKKKAGWIRPSNEQAGGGICHPDEGAYQARGYMLRTVLRLGVADYSGGEIRPQMLCDGAGAGICRCGRETLGRMDGEKGEKGEKVKVNIPNNENKQLCGKCGGECCKACPGEYTPEDIEQLTADFIAERLIRGEWIIGYIGHFDFNPQYYLRPAGKEETGPFIEKRKDLDFECVYLTGAGCSLKFEDRPEVCRDVIPAEESNCRCGGEDCNIWDISEQWKPYYKILLEAAEKAKRSKE